MKGIKIQMNDIKRSIRNVLPSPVVLSYQVGEAFFELRRIMRVSLISSIILNDIVDPRLREIREEIDNVA